MIKGKQQKGAAFVLTAILLPVMLAFTGIAVDIGRLYMEKGRLQHLADAAVLSALAEIKKSANYVEGTGKLSTNIPIGALSANTIAKAYLQDIQASADEGADLYLVRNSGEEVFRIGANGVESVVYTLKNSDSNSNIYTYYYEIIVGKEYPLFFARILRPNDMLVRAGAVCRFDIREEKETISYSEALQRWGDISTVSKAALLTISSATRLDIDREALGNLANYFLGKNASQVKAVLGSSSASNALLGHYQEGAAASVYTKNTVEANNLFSLLQGHDPGTDTFDSTQRYLFSDYAVKNKDGFKLWLTYTNGTVTKAQVRINPNDAANGSAPLDVTVP